MSTWSPGPRDAKAERSPCFLLPRSPVEFWCLWSLQALQIRWAVRALENSGGGHWVWCSLTALNLKSCERQIKACGHMGCQWRFLIYVGLPSKLVTTNFRKLNADMPPLFITQNCRAMGSELWVKVRVFIIFWIAPIICLRYDVGYIGSCLFCTLILLLWSLVCIFPFSPLFPCLSLFFIGSKV